ncbi:MAG: TlpA disulfide reductase family protein, partial [Actinomycetota bacterium]|nr:TlpA disulfide reductase family protein [Actinomycetota bacterium]
GVQFVGLDTRDSATAAQAFVNRFGLTYPQAIDTDGRVQLLFRDTLPAQAIPSTLIVDAEGKVAARFLGATTAAALRNVIDDVRASTK